MKIVSGIIMNESYNKLQKYIDSGSPKLYVSKFLKDKKARELLNENKFEELFVYWGQKNPQTTHLPLIASLLYSEIPFLNYMKEIPVELFESCDFIDEIKIPSNIKVIKGFAFGGCKNLKKVTIPNRKILLWEKSFRGWNFEGNIYFNGTKEELKTKVAYAPFEDVLIKCTDGDITL